MIFSGSKITFLSPLSTTPRSQSSYPAFSPIEIIFFPKFKKSKNYLYNFKLILFYFVHPKFASAFLMYLFSNKRWNKDVAIKNFSYCIYFLRW